MQTIAETLQPDLLYRVRERIGPRITQFGRRFGQPEYRLRETEYVGTVQQPLDEFTETLRDHGFEWDPLAWYHQPPVGSGSNGSWTYRQSLLADRQIHIILIAHSPEYIDVFAHEEYSWLRHPLKHLWQVDIRRKAGRNETRRWLRSRGIGFDVNSRRRRRVRRGIKGLRKSIESVF